MDWANKDGNKYTKRNDVDFRDRIKFFEEVIPRRIQSVFELGCNKGHNLEALRKMGLIVSGCDINHDAVKIARRKGLDVKQGSAYDFKYWEAADLILTAGLLIHINPIDLSIVFDNLDICADQYVLMIEHKEPAIRTIIDRWYKDGGSMWVMDFGAEFIKRETDFKLIKEGWVNGKKPDHLDYTKPLNKGQGFHDCDYYYLLKRK